MDFAGDVAVARASPVVFAGDVAVAVSSPAVAGAASPGDLAEAVAVDVTSLTDAGMVTVCVAVLADAGREFPADPAGVVTVGVPSRSCWDGHRRCDPPGRCYSCECDWCTGMWECC